MPYHLIIKEFPFFDNMRKFLVFILKNSEIVLYFYNLFYRLKNKAKYYSENERRQNLSMFDYKALAQPIPYYPKDKVRDTNYYGYAREIKKYAGIDKINALMEHGLFLGNRVLTAEGYRTTRSILTMSQNRVDSIKQHGVNKPIVAIGPYIHYAEPFFNEEEFKSLKKELGRILLVMPVHAAKGYIVNYNHKLMLDFIDKIKDEYDTVMVCIHFRDVLNDPDCVSDYEEKGYKVVSAGNEYDYNFVRRLKSIILLADYVISNNHGSNTGYCLYLGKPQTIVYDKDLTKKGYAYYTDEAKKIRDAQVKEIEEAFSEYSPEITDYQRQVIEKYWGLSLIKSPEELREALKTINK